MVIGVVAMQGGFEVHQQALEKAGYASELIRYPKDVDNVDGIILPGGESSTQLRLLNECGLIEPLQKAYREGRPIFCTCAGIILAAQHVTVPEQDSFGWIPISVRRNGYGDQRHSFDCEVPFQDDHVRLVFIRAPLIESIHSDKVEVLLSVDTRPVLVRYKNILAATFHPELTDSSFCYRLWLQSGEGIPKESHRRADIG